MRGTIKALNIKTNTSNGCLHHSMMLRIWLTNMLSDLYFPMEYFVRQKDMGGYADALKGIRERIFNARDRITINNNTSVDQYQKIINETLTDLKEIHQDMLFIAATVPEEHRWVVSCNINKQTSGVLKSWFNDLTLCKYELQDVLKSNEAG